MLSETFSEKWLYLDKILWIFIYGYKDKEEYEDDRFLWRCNLICTYVDSLLANKLPLKSSFLKKSINLLKKFIWRSEPWNPVTSRMEKEPSFSRTQSNIQERALSESSQWPRAVNYFRKELHVRRSTWFWLRLWPRHGCLWTETQWVNISRHIFWLRFWLRHGCLWTETHWMNISRHVTQSFIENIVPNFENHLQKTREIK